MSYLSLARIYRPQDFDEIAGQEHIATTLKNAITMEHVAHAYLFAGPRGVGKTSTARILAKALNCEKGPTQKPCGKCAACREITQGASMDVVEIDGASNRGIDEIRNLRESVKFASARGKFRIYIIDEVHMLTQEAFNALLKTLEEPPLHVKFIFATTRPYKVPATIISRCQRFDFRKIPAEVIAKKLGEIREKEKLEVKEEAISMIAKASDGSMRDAEVILDQLLAFTKGRVEAEDVVKVLGLVEQGALFALAGHIADNEKGKIIHLLNEIIESGKDPIFVATSLIEHFRNIMVAKVSGDKATPYEEQGRRFSLDEILYITYTLSAAVDLMKKTSLSQIPLEIALIRLTERSKLASVKEILDRLSLMEGKLRGAAEEGAPSEETEEAEEAPLHHSSPLRDSSGAGQAVAEKEVTAEKDILLLQKIKSSWPKILNFIKIKKMALATFLAEGSPRRAKDSVLTIGFAKTNSLHKEALEADANKKFVEEAIKNIVGENVFLNVETVHEEAGPAAEAAVALGESPEEETVRSEANKVESIVESALDIFDGRITDIKKDARKVKT